MVIVVTYMVFRVVRMVVTGQSCGPDSVGVCLRWWVLTK